MDSITLTSKIKELYKEYCLFSNIENYIPIDITYNNSLTFSVKAGNPSTLSVNDKLLNLKWNQLKPTLYHEFTHIIDYAAYFQSLNDKDRTFLLKLYTEIHATNVELKAATGFSNVNERIILTANSPIVCINDSITTIGEFIIKADKILSKAIDDFIKSKTQANFLYLLDIMCYAIGRERFINKYLTNYQFDPTQMLRLMDLFGDDLLNVMVYSSKENISENDIVEIFKHTSNMRKKYE